MITGQHAHKVEQLSVICPYMRLIAINHGAKYFCARVQCTGGEGETRAMLRPFPDLSGLYRVVYIIHHTLVYLQSLKQFLVR